MKDPRPSDIFSAGQVLNNTYEIKGLLGRGGTGEVYLAVNQITERLSAIKALNARFSGNADYLELMKREEQMRNIMHNAVVRYSECSRTDDGHVFLVMDYVDGVALSDLMFERRLSDQELLIVAHRVLSGLEATHAQGIVHRDLSPDNIILRDGEAAKATIIDFGIAKDTAAGARTIVGTNFAGKYEYAAPEQLDGRADYRTDLYALGASLLAVARREVPDVGTNPGEVVRFKKEPLDTSGLDAPLRDLVTLLCAPDPADRPETARAALDQLDRWLKPDTHRASTTVTPRRGDGQKKPGGRGLLFAAVAVVVMAGAALATLSGGWLTPALPVASPYTLTATSGGGEGTLVGHAPDAEAAALLSAAYAGASGRSVPEDALQLADGAPDPDWPSDIADVLTLMEPMSDWQLDVSDRDLSVTGLAPDRMTRDATRNALTDWAARSGLQISREILAGPETLATGALRPILDAQSTCGPLTVLGDDAGTFAMYDTVTVTGDVASAKDIPTLEQAISPMIGERDIRMEVTVLNSDLCAIRAVLPPAASGAVSIWLGRGDTGEPALTGVFNTGDNPVVDIQMPATITDASLWVMVVDNTGKVFNILPNINQTEHLVDNLGQVANGVRRIRVLWPIAALQEDPSRLAIEVDADNYGKSEIVAILSREKLFDMRRPRDESVKSVAQALAEALEGREEQILGVAARIIDARP
ncbi:protein kinase [Sulfitobacter sp. HNIBRBA3233]|uniref:serine/threonine protein kinase n=1 Tax=Sulfitobacter marinivivus TaxID=3158558 RepID=UPI0032DFF00F